MIEGDVLEEDKDEYTAVNIFFVALVCPLVGHNGDSPHPGERHRQHQHYALRQKRKQEVETYSLDKRDNEYGYNDF